MIALRPAALSLRFFWADAVDEAAPACFLELAHLFRWAAAILGKQGAEADDYVASVVVAELGKQGEENVIAKLTTDLAAKGIDRYRVAAELEKALRQAKIELGAPK